MARIKHLIALAGNPNAGKSTIFNALTGSSQHVGNWPGKTVEKKEGIFTANGHVIHLVDLPGTYSLSAYSLEEQIARDFIVNEKPCAIINVVDASNIERHMYLTAQILEIGVPVILVLNMLDVAAMHQIHIDVPALSAALHDIPVIPVIAREGKGLAELQHALLHLVSTDSLHT